MLTPGQILAGKYRIDRLLGAGGMGSVYVATNLMLEKQVALKVMGRDFVTHADWVQRFFREGVAASRVKHSGVVQVFDAGDHEGAPWMAMELLEGESLRARLQRNGRLSSGETLAIARQALGALAAVHDVGIVHRDLKPDNVFLEHTLEGERIKVLDFGIAKEAHAVHSLTQTGTMIGTAHYLAPEQARDSRTVDPRTDLYAMGVILFECLSGAMPYEANTVPELIAKMFSEAPRDLMRLAPDVPPYVAHIVQACLAHDPNARPQTARALLAMLDSAASAPRTATGPVAQQDPAWRQAFASAPTFAHSSHASAPPPSTQLLSPAPQRPMAAPVQPAPRSGSSWWIWVVGILGVLGLGGLAILGLIIAVGVWTAQQVERAAGGVDLSGLTALADRTIWDASHPPLLVDVNGDGHEDLVGFVVQIGVDEMPIHFAAFDGRTGTVIWRGEGLGNSSDFTQSHSAVVGSTLMVGDPTGTLRAFSLRDGLPLWTAPMGERLQRYCAAGEGNVIVETVDRRRMTVSLTDGHTAPAEPGPCDRVLDDDIPYGTSTRMAGNWTSEDTFEMHDPPGISLDDAFRDPATRRLLLLGQRSPGTATPIAVLLNADGTDAWSSDVPGVPPLTAEAVEPTAGAISGDDLFLVYRMGSERPNRVTSFALTSGGRAWDVEIPGDDSISDTAVAGRELLTVCHMGKLDAFDRTTGRRLFSIGPADR